MNTRMIGRSCPYGPGGRDCSCCGQAPGKWRVIARRAAKRGESQKIRQDIRNYLSI